MEDNFSTNWGGGDGFSMIQVPYTYCALFLYYSYISSTSDHQVLDPEGWGPLLYMSQIKFIISIGGSTPVFSSLVGDTIIYL